MPGPLPAPTQPDVYPGSGGTLDAFSTYIAPNQGDAWAFLKSVLDHYGLSSLDAQAQGWVEQNLSNAQVAQSIRQTPAWKQVFKPILDRQQMGLPTITEDDVLNLRRQYAQIDLAHGAPQDFNGTQDYDAFITNDMSANEYNDRWNLAEQQVALEPPGVQYELASQFGATPGHMASYFLDPTKTLNTLQRNVTAAQIGATGLRAGYGQVDQTTLQNLAGQGITASQATQGFGTLANEAQLFNALPGENQNANITQAEQIGAQFNNQAAAQRRIAQRSAERAAAFTGGGTFGTNANTARTGAGVSNAP